jgi:hypothetical protein
VGADLEVFHGKRSDSRGQRRGGAAVSERGCGATGGPLERRRFLAIAVVGLLFAPGLRLLSAVLLFFGVAAVPPALRLNR